VNPVRKDRALTPPFLCQKESERLSTDAPPREELKFHLYNPHTEWGLSNGVKKWTEPIKDLAIHTLRSYVRALNISGAEGRDVVDYVELLYSPLLPLAFFTLKFPTG
jgi:hypothetical protein